MKLPTDRAILEAIFKMYRAEYLRFYEDRSIRPVKQYVEIDIPKVAERLGTDMEIVFTRLYNHLEPKHGYKNDEGDIVYFFRNGYTDVDGVHRKHLINFTLMGAVLSELRREHRQVVWTLTLSIVATAISIGSLVVSIVK